jgi:ABC-2 type transport system ATP-binding protein
MVGVPSHSAGLVRATCQLFTVFAYHPDVQPLLASESLRVDVARIPAVDGLSLTSTGDRLLVLGAPRALFEASAGLRPSTRGELRVSGELPIDALRRGVAASAPLDPPMPPDWTVRHYVTWSARLAGHARATSVALADDAIERMKLEAHVTTKLARVPVSARHAAVIAGALATGATIMFIEDPLAGLAAETARSFARVIVRALSGRRSAIFAARVALDSPLALAADEAIIVEGALVAAQGAPAEIAAGESAFVLRVGGDAQAFLAAVKERGGRLLVGPPEPKALARMTVDFGGLRTRDVLSIAAASNAIVLELRPLARSFA